MIEKIKKLIKKIFGERSVSEININNSNEAEEQPSLNNPSNLESPKIIQVPKNPNREILNKD